jgi:hypothetical protein
MNQQEESVMGKERKISDDELVEIAGGADGPIIALNGGSITLETKQEVIGIEPEPTKPGGGPGPNLPETENPGTGGPEDLA